jgi:hypothetical protein
MYIESYYLETKEWQEEFIKALKELDELYPFTKAYEPEVSKTIIKGSYNTLLAPGLSALRYTQDRSRLQNMQREQFSGYYGNQIQNDYFNKLAQQSYQQQQDTSMIQQIFGINNVKK